MQTQRQGASKKLVIFFIDFNPQMNTSMNNSLIYSPLTPLFSKPTPR